MFSPCRSLRRHARYSLCRGAALARPLSLPLCTSGSSNLRLSVTPSFSLSLSSLFRKSTEKTNPLLSNPYALFKKSVSVNSFTISSFRTLLQNTGGIPPSHPKSALGYSTASLLNSLESALTKNVSLTPLQSALTKTQYLKLFRIITYEKDGGRGSTC
jgi:hypothetical protein